MTTAFNVETVYKRVSGLPYMETIALRGLIPLHVPHKVRCTCSYPSLPFHTSSCLTFDTSLSIVVTCNPLSLSSPFRLHLLPPHPLSLANSLSLSLSLPLFLSLSLSLPLSLPPSPSLSLFRALPLSLALIPSPPLALAHSSPFHPLPPSISHSHSSCLHPVLPSLPIPYSSPCLPLSSPHAPFYLLPSVSTSSL